MKRSKRHSEESESYFLLSEQWRNYLKDSRKLDYYLSEARLFLNNIQEINIMMSNKLIQITGWNIVFITALIGVLFKNNLQIHLKYAISGVIIVLIMICLINLLSVLPTKISAKGTMPEKFFTEEVLDYINTWYDRYDKDNQQSFFILETLNANAQQALKENDRKSIRLKLATITLMFSILFLASIVCFA